MVSPVPKHLRTEAEHRLIPERLREHRADIVVGTGVFGRPPSGSGHRARFAPGLPTALMAYAHGSIGDPMAGTGTLAWECSEVTAVNDIDPRMAPCLEPLRPRCKVTCQPADEIGWSRDTLVFSPPYYPRTDRRRPNAHDDAKRGPVVGFRDSYGCDLPGFIGDPGGVHAIRDYREAMTKVYAHLRTCSDRLVVVTKNWWRLGVELRLDLDTILMAADGGWVCTERHGWSPPPSLWSRYNQKRGGFTVVEDVLVFG